MEHNRQTNCASKYGQSLKVFTGFWPAAVAVVYSFGKVNSSGQFRELQSQFCFLKQATSKNVEHLQQAITVQQT